MNLTPPAGPFDSSNPRSEASPVVRVVSQTASMQNLLFSHFGGQVPDRPLETPQAANIAPPTNEEWPVAARLLIESLMGDNARLKNELSFLKEQIESASKMADHDVLTPTLNRRAFVREMARAMADCKRYGETATLIFLDLDGFKGINDTYGHPAGDKALIYVAETLSSNIREGDSVGRMGGDEFAVLLRHADLSAAKAKAQKLEAELQLGTFEYNGLYLKIGGSFGVRGYAGQASVEEWIAEADAAMFLVKKTHR